MILFIRTVSKGQVITEYSSEYVALAELPSQLSFTYYGEKEWEEKLKEFLHKKNLDGKLTYGKLGLSWNSSLFRNILHMRIVFSGKRFRAINGMRYMSRF